MPIRIKRTKWQFSLPLIAFFTISIIALIPSFTQFNARDAATSSLQQLALLLLASGYLYLNRSRLLAFRTTHHSIAIYLFLAFAGISVIWSIDPLGTLAYAVAAAGLGVALGLFASADRTVVADTGLRVAWAILIVMLALPYFLEVRERSFGFIAPNLVASYGFVCIVLATFSRHRWRWVPILGGFYLIYFSEGRAVLLAAVVYMLALAVPKFFTKPNHQLLLLLAVIAGAVFFVLNWASMSSLIVNLVSAPLGITQGNRLDGTLTGRSDHWTVGMRLFEFQPTFGYGFGTRLTTDAGFGSPAHNAHSGFINLLLDLGLVGAALFGLALLLAVRHHFRAHHILKRPLAWHMLAFILAYAMLLFVEPNYLALQHPIAIVLFMALFGPVFRDRGEYVEGSRLLAVSAPRAL